MNQCKMCITMENGRQEIFEREGRGGEMEKGNRWGDGEREPVGRWRESEWGTRKMGDIELGSR